MTFILVFSQLFITCENRVWNNPYDELGSNPMQLPTVVTTAVSNINGSTASVGYDVTSDGGVPVTARGVCWATTQNPTIFNSKTANGAGTGEFTSSITGLTTNTTYYVRAYATNPAGTRYGSQVSFKTFIADDGTTGTVTYNGYTYKTVYIGGRKWFAENLRTITYKDGTAIPNVTDGSTWSSLSTPAYCWYHNDEATNKPKYGALYNWYTVNTGKLCPTGWHVPTNTEWTELTDYIGYDSGTKLKATSGWTNGGGTDDYGFSALPGGMRFSFGTFSDDSNYDAGYAGVWWSATESNETSAWEWNMYYDSEYVPLSVSDKPDGVSVRCARDNE